MNRKEDETGSVLVEVLVSAIVLTIAAIGVFSAFDAATRSSAEERHRARAHGLAQADLARLRTMRISQLSPFLDQTTTEIVDGTPYTVHSRAEFVDATGQDTCDEENASADYILISSTVSWPSMGERKPVFAESIVAPPNSTTKAESGALIVEVLNGKGEPTPGVPIAGSGPTPFSRETAPNGCAIFGGLLAGDYDVTATVPGMVDPHGDDSGISGASVVGEATSTLTLEYDVPGALIASFVTRPESPTAEPVPAKAQAVTVFHTRMTEARGFMATEPAQAAIEASQLFPFDSPYAVYAGACEANNPDPKGENPSAAITEVEVEAGAEPTIEDATELELPALRLKVYSGTSESPGSVVEGAKITVRDTACPAAGLPTLELETNEDGELDEPGLHFSRNQGSSGGYEICVSGQSTSGLRKETISDLNVPEQANDIEGGTPLTVFLGDESSTGSDCW